MATYNNTTHQAVVLKNSSTPTPNKNVTTPDQQAGGKPKKFNPGLDIP